MTYHEKGVVQNSVNRAVLPSLEWMKRELVELNLALDREEPNAGIALRRVRQIEVLVKRIEHNLKNALDAIEAKSQFKELTEDELNSQY